MKEMEKNYHASESELEVMRMLWKQTEGIKQSQLLELFTAEGQEWKRQTLNTFLARLETKGLVIREKGLVWAGCTAEEYGYAQVKGAIDELYDGKLVNFLAALVRKNAVSKEEVREMSEYLKGL